MSLGLIPAGIAIGATLLSIISIGVIYESNSQYWFLTPAYLFAGIFSVMVLAGSVFILPDGDPRIVITSSLGLFGFAVGTLSATRIFDHRPAIELDRYLNKAWRWRWAASESGLAALVAGGFATLVLTILYFVAHGMTISNAARNATIAGSTYYIYAIMVALPFFVTLLVLWSRISNTVRSSAIALGFVVFAVVVSGLTGYRAPVGHILILALLADQFYNERLHVRWLGIAAITFLSMFVAISVGRYMRGDRVGRAFAAIWDRIVMVNPENLGFILSFFPARHQFLLGGSYLMDIHAMAPGPDKAFSGWMTAERVASLADDPVGMTPTLVGESYANFGLIGVFAIPLLFGFLLQTSWIAVLRRPKELDFLALAIVVWLFAAKVALRGIGGIAVTRFIPLAAMFASLEFAYRFEPVERLLGLFTQS
jgi:oligosaccharide repeat unit polymerase